MPTGNRGQTPDGFRHQLLQRLRNQALRDGVAAQRLQQQIAFERLLARLANDGEWILKGGFALQLRYGLLARPTRDIDLRTPRNPIEALDRLREVLYTTTVADNFSFVLGETIQEMQGAPGGSIRVKVPARIAGVEFVTFDVDLSSGDALAGSPDLLRGSGLLEFAGIEPIAFPSYPVIQHLAEKLHAYTLPRVQENTRVKDLVDLVFLAITEKVVADDVREAVEATFQIRDTHPIPSQLPTPPLSWAQPFGAIAVTVNLPVRELQGGHRLAANFWDPLLMNTVTRQIWLPKQKAWHPASENLSVKQ